MSPTLYMWKTAWNLYEHFSIHALPFFPTVLLKPFKLEKKKKKEQKQALLSSNLKRTCQVNQAVRIPI